MEQKLSIDAISMQSSSMTERLSSLFTSQSIVSDEDLSLAAEALSQISVFLKRIEAARVTLVKPLNDHVSGINKRVKDFLLPVQREDIRLRGLMSLYRAECERKRKAEYEAEMAKISANSDDCPIPEVVAPVPTDTSKSVSTSAGSVSFMTVWNWEVENLDLIPRKYFQLDEALITKLVKAGERDIPGVKIFARQSPVIRK